MAKPAWAPQFEEYAQRLLDVYGTPGMMVAVAKDGQPIYEHGFGHRDREAELPITRNTVFGIGSVTKSMACLAIMQLQEQGKLSVHDPIVKHVPEFRAVNEQFTKGITIHHFMTHTSGLPPTSILNHCLYPHMKDDPSAKTRMSTVESIEPIVTTMQLIEKLAELELEPLGEPGTVFSYYNDGYAILGEIIERLSGQSLEDYFQEQVFGPAGMHHSTYLPAVMGLYPDVTVIYAEREEDGEIYRSNSWWESPAMLAAGFVKSSAADMMAYLEVFRTGGKVGDNRILSDESVKQMCAPHVLLPSLPGAHYGYGLTVTTDQHGHRLVEHGGSLKGIAAWVSVLPDQGLTAVGLSNLAGSPTNPVVLGALNGARAFSVDAPRHEWPEQPLPSRERLEAYVGKYSSDEGETVEFTLENGQLIASAREEVAPARYIGNDTVIVRIKEMESAGQFMFNDKGEAYALAFHYRVIRRAE